MALLQEKLVLDNNIIALRQLPREKKQLNGEELSIRINSSHYHKSAMSEKMKKEACENSPSLSELFDATLQKKGELDLVQSKIVDDNTIEVEGLSQATLHSYILEAEKLGKTVEYKKSFTIKILS